MFKAPEMPPGHPFSVIIGNVKPRYPQRDHHGPPNARIHDLHHPGIPHVETPVLHPVVMVSKISGNLKHTDPHIHMLMRDPHAPGKISVNSVHQSIPVVEIRPPGTISVITPVITSANLRAVTLHPPLVKVLVRPSGITDSPPGIIQT